LKYLHYFKFNPTEEGAEKNLKLFISMMIGLLILVGIITIAIFFIALKGAEQTLVPEVRGKDLAEALLDLQTKELYPRIQLRYSQTSRDRGQVLEQEPGAGTIVKAGRQVRLVVSQGVMLNRVEKYVGKNIDEVRMDLQVITAAGSPLLTLKEPLIYDFSSEAPGTILRQKPEAGTDISGPMNLEFVVSRGLENVVVTVPQLTGLSLSAVLEQIGRMGIVFEFSVREIRGDEKGEMVVQQSPPAGASATTNTIIDLTVSRPGELKEGEVFKLFTHTMPRNPYPLPVRLEAVYPNGDRIRIISADYPGGKFAVPYRLPVNSTLILSVMNREIHRETVQE
jgi:beta-lactam-binding protein with PASTA domain